MATAGGIVVLHPAGTGGGDIQQPVVGDGLVLQSAEVAGGGDVQQPAVVAVVLIHSGSWQCTQVCDLLESLHHAGTGGDVQHSVVVGNVLVLRPAGAGDGDVQHHTKDLSSTSSHTPW